jgi:chaperonin GroEL (HSP60 family)
MDEKTKANDRKQAAVFRKAARELGCDESEDRFRDALRTVAKAKPSPEKGKGRRPTKG